MAALAVLGGVFLGAVLALAYIARLADGGCWSWLIGGC